MRQTRILGNICDACNKRFATKIAYNQHRRSPHLIGTPCYTAMRCDSELVASSRANMSTAMLRSGHFSGGIGCDNAKLEVIMHVIDLPAKPYIIAVDRILGSKNEFYAATGGHTTVV